MGLEVTCRKIRFKEILHFQVCKEIQPVHPKGDQSWVFIGRTDAEAETPNTLATSCEELTHWKKTRMLGGIGGRRRGRQRMRWLNGITT